MKKRSTLTFLSLLFTLYLAAQSTPAENGHSLFNIMPNYHVDKYSLVKKEFDQLTIRVANKKESVGYVEEKKEGELEECTFRFNADEIKASLAAEGKVSFYGIFFDTDKAVVKPESAPTRTAIAAFLKANPATSVFIVGHTDNTGDFIRNSTLSKDRATAVVTELTTKYSVNKTQVTAQGVASLAPVAPNDTEEGKARNRRVEIVKK